MPQISIDTQFEALLAIGVGQKLVGVSVKTSDRARPVFGFTIPADQMSYYLARLSAAAARLAQMEASDGPSRPGPAAFAAMARHSLRVTGVAGAGPGPGDDSLRVFLNDESMGVLPLELTREAASALAQALAAFVAGTDRAGAADRVGRGLALILERRRAHVPQV